MTTDKPKRGQQQAGALMWPIILIGVGIIWLLGNLGIVTGANIAVLFQLWPLFLIIIGLDMLIRHDNPQLRPLLGVGAVIILVGAALFGPSLGLGGDQIAETRQYDIPLEGVEAAEVRIDAESAPLQLVALVDSSDLAQIQIVDTGQIDVNYDPIFREGQGARIEVSRRSPGFGFFADFGGSNRGWDIRLSDRIPVSLNLDLASGESTLDLRRLRLDQLTINGGSGPVNLELPGGAYNFESDHSSGPWEIALPDNGDFQWVINDLGSGNLTIQVPTQLGLRIDIQDGGSGSLNLPSGWEQLRGDDREGEWESANYSNADYRATITVRDRGSGDIFIRQQGS